MPFCLKCGRQVCIPCVANDNRKETQPIIVASDLQLSRTSHVQRLAIAMLNVKQEKNLSRRDIPDWLADVIYGYGGRILWPVGLAFEIGDEAIDLAFGDDGSFRWLTDFLGFANTPPKQRPQKRVLERLRLIDLAFRIEYPKRALFIAK